MEHRHWHAAYPAGMPIDVTLPAEETLATMVEQAMNKFADRPAATSAGESLSYGELESLSSALGAYLLHLDLGKGDRVGLMMPNGLGYHVSLVATLRAALVAVPVNPLYTPRELRHQLSDAGVRVLFLADQLLESLRDVVLGSGVELIITVPTAGVLASIAALPAASFRRPTGTSLPLAQAISQTANLTLEREPCASSDAAFLQYTGGTTGLSKGAILTHRGFGIGVLQSLSWIQLAVDTSKWSVVAPLPLYHVYPLQIALITMRVGGVMRLLSNPRDPSLVIAEMKRAPFLVFIGVNTLYNALVNAPEFNGIDFSGTELVIGAGASIQQAVSLRWREAGGPPITEAYGLTETSPPATFNPPGHNGSIGIPVPSTDARIVDDEGRDVPAGVPGELLLKGPQLFAGYWKRAEETRAAMTEDGFFRTGDIVVADDKGSMVIVDRKKDMILVSGFNVYPNEIEAVVAQHADVLECACVGQPDARSGESPHLFIVPRRSGLTTAEIETYCRANLAPYKVPRQFTFVSSLPKSTVGKILRRELRSPSPPS